MARDGRPVIAVVGAGIGGLTLAAALAAEGVECEVFERAERIAQVGAGIQLAPNAVRLLNRLGAVKRIGELAVRPEAIEMRRWDDGDLLARTVLGAECERVFGAPYLTVHRADLHAALLDLADADRVRLGRRLARLERPSDQEAVLCFEDGTEYRPDVVVGADGIRSVVRESLVVDEPVFAGQTVYRGLVPADRLPDLAGDPKVRLWMGPAQHCVCYPVSGGRLISFAATVPAVDGRGESWTAPGDPAALVAAYAGWSEDVARLLDSAVDVTRWALHDREPLRHWSAGCVTVLGDAAHPMLPFMAQGANQAIEDAIVLAGCLAGIGRQDIPKALSRYEALRSERTATVQQGSRGGGRIMHLPDGWAQRRRDTILDGRLALRNQAWLYGYDAQRALS